MNNKKEIHNFLKQYANKRFDLYTLEDVLCSFQITIPDVWIHLPTLTGLHEQHFITCELRKSEDAVFSSGENLDALILSSLESQPPCCPWQ